MDSSPEQLRSILKSSFSSPTTGKTAKTVFVSHSQHLQLISPLPGWRSDRIRMPLNGYEEDTVAGPSIDTSQDRGGTLKLRRLSLFVPAKKRSSKVRMTAGAESSEKKRRRKTGQAIAMNSAAAPAAARPRGILKPAGRPFPPPRKSSLSAAAAGKTIVKKYRKVRVSRLLRFKLIQAMPGFRTDRPRLPHIDPDEEEQQRLAEQEEAEKIEKKRKKREARVSRTRNRRKTVGGSAAPSSDDESGAEEASNSADLITARSPDVYCEAYMQVDSPDAVLTDREAGGWRDRQLHTVGGALFPIDNRADTVASQTTVSIAAKPSAPRRRSLRIQERDEARRVQAEAAAAAAAASPVQVEKRQRRRSRMFTTSGASPVPRRRRSSVSNEKSDQSQRRKSRMFVRQPAASADEMSEKSGRSGKSDEQMEFARCSDSYESQCTQWSSGCELLAEAFSPPRRKPMRRGRRSMKLALEDIPSSEAEESRQHPFFSQFAASPIAATVATVLAERKPAAARRRTFFVPKKSLPEPEDEESDGDSDEVVKKMRRLSVQPGKDDVQ